MNRRMLVCIGMALIGVGFIIMSAGNTLHSETASVLQAVLGAVFIVTATVRFVSEYKKNK